MSLNKLKKLPSSATMGTLEALTGGIFWGRTQLEYTSGNPIYKGLNYNYLADDSDTDWFVTKFTWSGNDPIDIQVQVGSWTDRASLGWV